MDSSFELWTSRLLDGAASEILHENLNGGSRAQQNPSQWSWCRGQDWVNLGIWLCSKWWKRTRRRVQGGGRRCISNNGKEAHEMSTHSGQLGNHTSQGHHNHQKTQGQWQDYFAAGWEDRWVGFLFVWMSKVAYLHCDRYPWGAFSSHIRCDVLRASGTIFAFILCVFLGVGFDGKGGGLKHTRTHTTTTTHATEIMTFCFKGALAGMRGRAAFMRSCRQVLRIYARHSDLWAALAQNGQLCPSVHSAACQRGMAVFEIHSKVSVDFPAPPFSLYFWLHLEGETLKGHYLMYFAVREHAEKQSNICKHFNHSARCLQAHRTLHMLVVLISDSI